MHCQEHHRQVQYKFLAALHSSSPAAINILEGSSWIQRLMSTPLESDRARVYPCWFN